MPIEGLITEATSWAESRQDIVGLALVGSHARGTDRPESDVDLIILCHAPESLIESDWPARFGDVASFAIEHYGAVTSRRVFYTSGLEVEFGIASPAWAEIPLDPGTRHVLASGCRLLHDPDNLFRMALQAAGGN